MYKLLLMSFFLLFISGCGGSGSSDDGGNTRTPPNVVPDPNFEPVRPNYTGLRTPYEITPQNAAETAYSALQSLDLLNSFAFGSTYQRFYFVAENETAILDGETQCETGTTSTNEVSDTSVQVNYNACVIEGAQIDGVIRASANESGAITVIPSVTLMDVVSTETSTLSGYFVLVGSNSVRYQMLISVNDTQAIWFDDVQLTANVFSDLYGITYSGDLYVSDQGKLAITTKSLTRLAESTNGLSAATIGLQGDVEIIAQANLQDQLTVSFSDQYTPVKLSLLADQTIDFELADAPPVAQVSFISNEMDRGDSLTFSASLSRDSNYEALTTRWAVIEQPQGANASLSQFSDTTFNAQIPGEYTLSLTVTDTANLQDSEEFVVRVLQNQPIAELSASDTFVMGTDISANVTVSNDEFDGPYTYRIKYGPANMSIDESGELSWDGVLPDYGYDISLNFAVYVSNNDRSVVLEKTINMQSVSEPTFVDRNKEHGFSNNQIVRSSQNKSYITNLGVQKFVFNDGEVSLEQMVSLSEFDGGNRRYQGVYDINLDGVDDYFFTYYSDTDTYVGWRDGVSKINNEFLRPEGFSGDFALHLFDYTGDGVPELFVSKSFGDVRVYDILTKQQIGSLDPNRGILITNNTCDLNDDGFYELVEPRDIFDFKNDTIIEATNEIFRIIDTDNNPACEFVSINNSNQIVVKDAIDGQARVIFDSGYFDAQFGFYVGNFDDDPAHELIIIGEVQEDASQPNTHTLLLDNLDADTPTFTRLHNSRDIFNSEFVEDIDNDGKDDFLFYEQETLVTANGNSVVGSYQSLASVDNGTIEDKYRTNTSLFRNLTFSGWDNNNNIIVVDDPTPGSDPVVSMLNEFGEVDNFAFNTSYIDAGLDEGALSIFTSDFRGDIVDKVDLFNNIEWSVALVETGVSFFSSLAFISNKLLIAEAHDKDWMIDPSTGNVLAEAIKRVSFSGIQSVYSKGPLQADYFASMRTRSVFKLENNQIELLNNDVFTNVLDESNNYTFSQFDTDPALELLVYSTFRQSYRVLDVESRTEIPLNQLHDGVTEHRGDLSDRVLAQCFDWDVHCRNYIISRGDQMPGYKVVDKFSGKLIWQTPMFSHRVNHIQFRRVDNNIATAGINFNSLVYSYELYEQAQ